MKVLSENLFSIFEMSYFIEIIGQINVKWSSMPLLNDMIQLLLFFKSN